MTRNMKRFNTQTRFVPLKIDEDFNVGHIQSKDGKVKDFKTRKAVEKYCKEKSLHLLRRKIHILQMIVCPKKAAQRFFPARLNFIFSNYSNHPDCSLHSLSNTENDCPHPHKPKSP